MAELDVQKKKSSPLPWILLIVAVLAVLAYFLFNTDKNEAVDAATPVYDSTTRTGADSLPQ